MYLDIGNVLVIDVAMVEGKIDIPLSRRTGRFLSRVVYDSCPLGCFRSRYRAGFSALLTAALTTTRATYHTEEQSSSIKGVADSHANRIFDLVSDPNADGVITARFPGMNVQVVNGGGQTDGPSNGAGNLIVEYNESVYSYLATLNVTVRHKLSKTGSR
jgi:hypothetical protein